MGAKSFFRKELAEIFRTSKIYIIPLLFLLFGFASPIVTKLLPDVLTNIGEIEIVLPEMTWVDSFDQFFKNLNQIGVIAILLVFMGTVAQEKSRGTAIMILSKPVSRTAFVLSKFCSAALLVLFSLIPAYLACFFYTKVLFQDVSFILSLQSALLFAVYIIYILGFTVGASAVMKNQIAAGGVSVGFLILTSLVPAFWQDASRFFPGSLTGYSHSLLTGSLTFSQTFPAVLSGLILTILFLGAGIFLFNKQEI